MESIRFIGYHGTKCGYAKQILETDSGIWMPDTNKRIAMAIMKDGFSGRDVERSMKNSPQKVSSMRKLLGKAEKSNETYRD